MMQKKNGKPDEVSANFHDLIEVIRLKRQTDIEKESAMVHSISTIQAFECKLVNSELDWGYKSYWAFFMYKLFLNLFLSI